jgi:hypothetical protein
MKLLVQPRDGISPLISAIRKAKSRIELVIFRFDTDAIEQALDAPPSHGAFGSARSSLIPIRMGGPPGNSAAFTWRRVTVDRTGDDFIRYHGSS